MTPSPLFAPGEPGLLARLKARFTLGQEQV